MHAMSVNEITKLAILAFH